MKILNWKMLLGLSLIALSALFYLLHFVLFRDAHHIFIYLVGDIAFVFIEVLMVTLIIHRVLEEREKRARLNKLYIVIGVFFSEMGTKVLGLMSGLDPKLADSLGDLGLAEGGTDSEFTKISGWLRDYDYEVDSERVDWNNLRRFLIEKRDFQLRLLENPNLLEHESFTELLRALLHLSDELSFREGFRELPQSDYKHLCGDIRRVYGELILQWTEYMKYLRNTHPYLFSLALRTNPFNPDASPVVME